MRFTGVINRSPAGNGSECEFRLTVKYDVPDVRTAAGQQGLTGGTAPFLLKEYVYDHSPVYSYSYQQAPCEWKTGGDTSVIIMDFYD